MNPRVLYRAATYATDARSTADSVISALTPAAWYRNATGVTSAGGFASQWDDYSGNGRHLIQGTGTNQPAYSAGVFTGDGADNFMTASSWLQTQPETIYIVGKQATWTASDVWCDGTTILSAWIYQVGSSPALAISAGSGAVASNTNAAVGSAVIACAVFNGASSSLRINNTAKTTGNASTNNMGGFKLFTRGDAAVGFFNGEAWEVVIFSAAHDDATQSSVITALNNALTVF